MTKHQKAMNAKTIILAIALCALPCLSAVADNSSDEIETKIEATGLKFSKSDGKIPEVGASSKSETPKSESSSETTRPKSSASTASADEIITKAEDHDGIVVGGFYLGMSPEDALVLCKHYFGHLGTVKLNKVVWKHYLDNVPSHGLQVKTFEGIVLVKDDGTYQAICSIGKNKIRVLRQLKRCVPPKGA